MSRPALPQARSNPALGRAVGTLEDYVRARSVAEQADARLAALLSAVGPGTVDDAIAEVFETGVVPEDFGADTARRRVEHDALAEREQIVRSLTTAARNQEEGAVEAGLDTVLADLHQQLEDVLAEARKVAVNLDGARDAQAAISAGPAAVKAWGHITALLPRYAQVREAQATAMHKFADGLARRARPDYGSTPVGSDAYLANVDSVWPGWRDRPVEDGMGGGRQTAGNWPDDAVELLVWLVLSDAQPWVPTRRQLDQLWEARLESALAPEEKGPHPDEVKAHPDGPRSIVEMGARMASGR